MKIAYAATVRFPTEKAHGIQIAKMCEAFATLGHQVTLYVPTRTNAIKEDPFEYYNVKKNFSLQYVRTPDLVSFGRIGFFISRLLFSRSLKKIESFKSSDLMFFRDEFVAWFLASKDNNSKMIWEAHRGDDNFFVRSILQKGISLVAISKHLADFYAKTCNITHSIIAPDGVDLKEFNIKLSRNEAKRVLGLPEDKNIVAYTGHLYDWKGADTLAEAAKFLTSDAIVLFVGGTDRDVLNFKERFGERLETWIIGRKPYKEIPLYLKAADVLILPNSAIEKISSDFTSPLKLFEYMASGTPIIASDLPSLREVLNDSNAMMVTPDNPKLIAEGISAILLQKEKGESFARQAFIDVQEFSWEKRALRILQQ